MSQLFVDKTIDINAPAEKVWDVIINPEMNTQWSNQFVGGQPMELESNWELGDSVNWRNENGTVIVQGTVTAYDLYRVLRFTVFDVQKKEFEVGEEDGITFILDEENGKTTLRVTQGDFALMQDGEKYKNATDAIWDKILPIIKNLAENEEN